MKNAILELECSVKIVCVITRDFIHTTQSG